MLREAEEESIVAITRKLGVSRSWIYKTNGTAELIDGFQRQRCRQQIVRLLEAARQQKMLCDLEDVSLEEQGLKRFGATRAALKEKGQAGKTLANALGLSSNSASMGYSEYMNPNTKVKRPDKEIKRARKATDTK